MFEFQCMSVRMVRVGSGVAACTGTLVPVCPFVVHIRVSVAVSACPCVSIFPGVSGCVRVSAVSACVRVSACPRADSAETRQLHPEMQPLDTDTFPTQNVLR